MKFTQSPLAGAYLIDLEKKEDDRGFFARMWDKQEFKSMDLQTNFVQASISHTKKRGTLRGMHFQREPYAEDRLIRVTNGAVFDVIVDLRKNSATYRQWFSVELSAQNRKSIYVPQGFAHGFITLTDEVEVSYQMTANYNAQAQAGVRYNDPAFGIKWPIEVTAISVKDANYPNYDPR